MMVDGEIEFQIQICDYKSIHITWWKFILVQQYYARTGTISKVANGGGTMCICGE